MKDFTLSDCVSRINQILNYPSVAYEDISHFFDQAISELNTTLHVAIPTVTEMISEIPEPDYTPLVKITGSEDIPTEKPSDTEGAYYLNTTTGKFGVYTSGWNYYDTIYGISVSNGTPTVYISIRIGTFAYWTPVKRDVTDLNMVDYISTDWIILFLIPYICYKYSIREGMDAGVFSEELTQGFQQLQEAYDVRETVRLNEVADKFAYRKLVLENINNLSKEVPTRAIYESMKTKRAIQATYQDFYNGGWGV